MEISRENKFTAYSLSNIVVISNFFNKNSKTVNLVFAYFISNL
jgi:hypothetical protein